jgi:hypothetical protein
MVWLVLRHPGFLGRRPGWCVVSMASPRCLFLIAWVCAIAGCGYGIDSNTPAPPLTAPAILQQPANQTVPMGLTATYGVLASGEFLQYQWTKNGVNVPGATGSSYVTAATTFGDTNSSFAVTVANSAGTMTSTAASLTVTARAPFAGDLRFQQVDAAATVNGYDNSGSGLSTMLSARSAQDFTSSLGTPLWTGGTGDCTVVAAATGKNCSWAFSEVPLAASLPGPGLVAGYASDDYSNFQYDLADPNWPNVGGGIAPASANSVATSLDLEPASQLFAVSWIQIPSNEQTEFSLVRNAVSPAGLQTAASQEGTSSRVITALSYDGGEITYLSYGWSADTDTVYEMQVSTASPADAPAAAADLAAQGYIITATGLVDSAGDVVFVGTRVQGDTMARPFMTAQGSNVARMMQEGYATVGVIVNSGQADPYTYLGER